MAQQLNPDSPQQYSYPADQQSAEQIQLQQNGRAMAWGLSGKPARLKYGPAVLVIPAEEIQMMYEWLQVAYRDKDQQMSVLTDILTNLNSMREMRQRVAELQQSLPLKEGSLKNWAIGGGAIVGRMRDGGFEIIKMHDSMPAAQRHAQAIKNKYPSMEVAVQTADGQVKMIGLTKMREWDDDDVGEDDWDEGDWVNDTDTLSNRLEQRKQLLDKIDRVRKILSDPNMEQRIKPEYRQMLQALEQQLRTI
jgi:hypothetical protein